VRYVPQVKKNLISVGALKTLGHAVSVRDDVLKITRGSMVVMKGVRHNNLYYWMGSTITGRVATSISSDGDCIQVWHMRLGHIGEIFFKLQQRRNHWKVHLPATWNWVDTTFCIRRRR